jgi:AraC family transcriptional regulator
MSTAIRILQGRFGRVALLDMDRPLVTHAHHHCHILLKASGSDTSFLVRNQQQPLKADTAVLVNAWEPHAYTHNVENGPRTVILALYVDCGWLARMHSRLSVSRLPHFFPTACVPISPRIRRLADDLSVEMLCVPEFPQDQLEERLFDVMMSVIDPFSEWRNGAGLIRAARERASDPRIRRAIGFLHENIGEDLDMESLAGRCNMSRAHFFALFRRCTNLTPAVYANVLRMESAIDSLSGSEESAAELSYRLGFSAQSHFTRFFRQHLGITPTDFRRKTAVFGAAEAVPVFQP